jgi:hypothetical protein
LIAPYIVLFTANTTIHCACQASEGKTLLQLNELMGHLYCESQTTGDLAGEAVMKKKNGAVERFCPHF